MPIRQWVLTLPFPLRYRLAFDRKLMTPVLAAFMRAVFVSLRRRARARFGVRRAKAGAVTLVQRFGGALNLHVHFHSLVFDGVYEALPDSRGIRFVALQAQDLPELVRVLADTVRRIAAALDRSGFGEGDARRASQESERTRRVCCPIGGSRGSSRPARTCPVLTAGVQEE